VEHPIARAFLYTKRPRHPTNLKDPKMHNILKSRKALQIQKLACKVSP
jgi:hypothetical protein